MSVQDAMESQSLNTHKYEVSSDLLFEYILYLYSSLPFSSKLYATSIIRSSFPLPAFQKPYTN